MEKHPASPAPVPVSPARTAGGGSTRSIHHNTGVTKITGGIAFRTGNSAAVATVNISGVANITGGITSQAGLLVNGGGVTNITGGIGGSLTVTGGTVDVTGNVTGNLAVSGGTVTITGNVGGARNATGGSALAPGCGGGNGLCLYGGALDVTSTAANALTATGGVGTALFFTGDWVAGSGIASLDTLQITGAGAIKAVGDCGIFSFADITIIGGADGAER
jgi:hypothetical protein